MQSKMCVTLLRSNNGKKYVESNLNTVDVRKPMLRVYKLEIDNMSQRPHFP